LLLAGIVEKVSPADAEFGSKNCADMSQKTEVFRIAGKGKNPNYFRLVYCAAILASGPD
jgi:hypothetical protein